MNDIDFTNPDNHIITSVNHLDTKTLVACKCGAVWSERPDVTSEEINSKLDSHKLYFNKPKTVTL